MENARIIECGNGLTLIVDRMEGLKSTAYSLVFRGGLSLDRSDRIGASLVFADLLSKGAGGLSAQELSSRYELKGIAHGEYAGKNSVGLKGLCLAEYLPEALGLTAKVVMKPSFPEEQLSPVKSLLLQDVESISDNPARWCMIELSKQYLPEPYSRPGCGEIAGIEGVGRQELFEMLQSTFRPEGAVLSVSGSVDADNLQQLVEELFGDWEGRGHILAEFGDLPPFAQSHIKADTAQTQIALAFPSASFKDSLFYPAALAHQILSGSSFGRLFTEVRVKRGLCYSVYASHVWNQLFGATYVYASTTPERAQGTLDTILMELERVRKGSITEEELARAKANLKSSVLLSQDSAGARANSHAHDWLMSGRVRTPLEIKEQIDRLTLEDVEAYFDKYSGQAHSLVVLGPEPLESKQPNS